MIDKDIINSLLRLAKEVNQEFSDFEKLKVVHGWINENLTIVKRTQSTIKSNFSSEEEDFLKYHLAREMSEHLMEDSIRVTVEPKAITTEVVAFKRVIK